MTENSEWKFDSETQLIKIGTEEDGHSIMGIYPKKNLSTVQFSLDESEMAFEMEKIQWLFPNLHKKTWGPKLHTFKVGGYTKYDRIKKGQKTSPFFPN